MISWGYFDCTKHPKSALIGGHVIFVRNQTVFRGRIDRVTAVESEGYLKVSLIMRRDEPKNASVGWVPAQIKGRTRIGPFSSEIYPGNDGRIIVGGSMPAVIFPRGMEVPEEEILDLYS